MPDQKNICDHTPHSVRCLELRGERQKPQNPPYGLARSYLPANTPTRRPMHAPNKPPVGPSSQAATCTVHVEQQASQTEGRQLSSPSVTRTRTYSSSPLVTRHSTSKHDARWTPEGALLARPASVTTTVRYRGPIPLPAEPCPDRRRRHPPDLDEYLLVPGARGLGRCRRLSLS